MSKAILEKDFGIVGKLMIINEENGLDEYAESTKDDEDKLEEEFACEICGKKVT